MILPQSQPVGTCQLKPDIYWQIDTLKYLVINHVEPMLDTMSVSLKISETKAGSKQVKSVQKMKMLLVEDSVLICDLLINAISHIDNITVTGTAATQEQAISQLNTGEFDMVLLDIELAQGNGFEVIKHIQQQHLLQNNTAAKLPVLMMLTNHAHPHYRSLAKTLGVPYFFDKSMDFELAIDAIELEADRFTDAKH